MEHIYLSIWLLIDIKHFFLFFPATLNRTCIILMHIHITFVHINLIPQKSSSGMWDVTDFVFILNVCVDWGEIKELVTTWLLLGKFSNFMTGRKALNSANSVYLVGLSLLHWWMCFHTHTHTQMFLKSRLKGNSYNLTHFRMSYKNFHKLASC